MDYSDHAIRQTARIAVLCWALGLGLRWSRPTDRRRLAAARATWTLGAVVLLVHIAAAFEFAHGWSHEIAWKSTAQRTFEVTGWRSGSGIWVNYAFAIVWGVDAAFWWRGLERYESRPVVLVRTIQGFLAFLIFQAAVVFAEGTTRWLSLGGFVILAVLGVRAHRAKRSAARDTP
jgi:hypothetical protein